MSDGENATPGLHGPSGSDGDNPWLTRNSRPSPGAAPWERSGISDREDIEPAETAGHHTDGVSVADLIAKLNGAGAVPPELRRPLAKPAAPPPAPPTEIFDAVRGSAERIAPDPDSPDTDVIPVVPVAFSELPDLALVRRRGRVPPSHVGPDVGRGKPPGTGGGAGR